MLSNIERRYLAKRPTLKEAICRSLMEPVTDARQRNSNSRRRSDKRMEEAMLNRYVYRIIFAVIVLLVFGGLTTWTQIKHQPDPRGKPISGQTSKPEPEPRHPELSKAEMVGRIIEPHQILASVYMQNLGTFATALRDQAQTGVALSADFARAIAGEMSRNFDKAEDHDREHVKTLSPEMRSKMVTTMNAMDT